MPVLNQTALKWALGIMLLPLVALLFVGGPVESTTPTFRYIWNFGHIGLFAAVTLLVHLYRPFQATLNVFIYLAIVFAASFVIEGVQRVLGRDFSTVDILRNLVGCAVALFFIARPYLHISALSFLAFVLFIDLLGFASTVWTDVTIQRRAPIIENFESEFMAARWKGELNLTTDHVKEGNFSGQVSFPAGQYPGVSFNNMLRDWSNYDSMTLHFFNPSSDTISLTVRLHDDLHEREGGFAFSDRYNQTFNITEGWNEITVLLADIRNAPNNRLMDLTKMRMLALFIANNEQAATLYFDDFRLN